VDEEFRGKADALFGFSGTERMASTPPGWLTPERVEPVLTFSLDVAAAYADALGTASSEPIASTGSAREPN
jgi:hypothetical protein